MNLTNPRILPYGDCALLVEFGNQVDRQVSERILALNDEIAGSGQNGIVETVPTFRSLLVKYNPLETGFKELSEDIQNFLAHGDATSTTGRHWPIPVCYEGDYAPDLHDVAQRLKMTPNEVIDQHKAVTYHVYMVGFVAGCPYLGDMPDHMALPRRSDPRTRVPDGSVAIAMTQTVIYPLVSPGGWHLIGKTPIKIFDLAWEEPALFSPGDKVTFDPIDPAEFMKWEADVKDGRKLEAL